MMTDMMQGLQVKQPQLVIQFDKEALFGLIGYPKEQKGRIVFLCSKAVWSCAGQDMLIGGGLAYGSTLRLSITEAMRRCSVHLSMALGLLS